MARHLAPFSCRQTIAEMVRRRSFGCVLPLGRHASTNGSKLIHCASDSIALSSFQEGQNARHHNRFKREQALVLAFAVLAGRKAMRKLEEKWEREAQRYMFSYKLPGLARGDLSRSLFVDIVFNWWSFVFLLLWSA